MTEEELDANARSRARARAPEGPTAPPPPGIGERLEGVVVRRGGFRYVQIEIQLILSGSVRQSILFLPPCLELCLSWTVRRFSRFSFSFSTFRLPRRSVGRCTIPSVDVKRERERERERERGKKGEEEGEGEGGPGQLSSRPPNYPLITSPDTLTLIHLFVFPSPPLPLPVPRSSSPPLPSPTPSLRRGWLATARLSPPVVNKNRSAELQVPVPVPLPSPLPLPPFRASRTSGYFFSDRAIERYDGWTFARPEMRPRRTIIAHHCTRRKLAAIPV